MRKLDLSKYEGHTKAPWKIYNTETKFSFSKGWKEIEPRVVMASSYNVYKSDGDYTECGVRIKEPDANLIEDAPLLLNRIKTLESMLEWRELSDQLPQVGIPVILMSPDGLNITEVKITKTNTYALAWRVKFGNIHYWSIGDEEALKYTHWKYVEPFDPYD